MYRRTALALILLLGTLLGLAVGVAAQGSAQQIRITAPEPGTTLDITAPVSVTGTAQGLFENMLVVAARRASGEVLAQQTVTVSTQEMGGAGTWTAALTIDVPAGMPGEIVAYDTSPRNGEVVAADVVPVTFGTPPSGAPTAQVTITAPAPDAALALTGAIPVTGTAQGIFENMITVEARHVTGEVLAQQTATVTTQEVGGAGPWKISLTVDVAPGTPGEIVAYDTSARTGAIDAFDSVPVVFGTSAGAPLGGGAPSGGTVYTVKAGDWLSKIARQQYGDANLYPAIVRATNEMAQTDTSFATIQNPSLIFPGEKLFLPDNPQAYV